MFTKCYTINTIFQNLSLAKGRQQKLNFRKHCSKGNEYSKVIQIKRKNFCPEKSSSAI